MQLITITNYHYNIAVVDTVGTQLNWNPFTIQPGEVFRTPHLPEKNSYYMLCCMLDLSMQYELQFACRQGMHSN